ncbi:MAG: [protein-PII] uridylyltransferase [Nitrospinota bacterium]|nr:[protein-PII] uridylyltransferase [Nitrospinota bacterium]
MNQLETPYQFKIDFSPLENIPADSKERLPYFDLFKGLLKAEKEKIKAWHRSGAGGREVIQTHTGLMDEAIRRTVVSLSLLDQYGPGVLEQFALVAVGGYGRGELNPCSDIDLLFILRKKAAPIIKEFIRELISIFWGIDLEIGHSCRTVKNCIELAREDLTVQTSMIEMRYLAGDPLLFEELNRSLGKSALRKNIKRLLDAKLSKNHEQYGSLGEWVCNAEPDIKNGPGGLRDYHTALWGVASQFGSLSFLEAGEDEAISEKELQSFNRSVDFFLRVRNELHYILGKKSDVLSLDIQSSLAVNLGYQNIDESHRVEHFMQDYFLHAKNIYNFSEVIFQRCLQTKRPYIRRVLSNLKKRNLGNGFYALNEVLCFEGNAEETFGTNKSLFLEVFSLCRTHGLKIDSQLMRQIRNHRQMLNEAFLGEKRVGDFLMAFLDQHDSEKTLRQMHESGILGQILPEFGNAYCSVKYDFYHRYTADEHSLRMVRFLEQLFETKEEGLKELAAIYKANPYKHLLKLAALLNPLGGSGDQVEKLGQGSSSSVITGQLAIEERDVFVFLLNNLHEMMETAFHQEIQHLSTIQAFAHKVESVERLNLLYLITYAELKAVAPDTWTSWKKFLLSELYAYTKDFLERPESFQQKHLSTRLEVYRRLHGEFFAWEIEQHMDWMPEDYWLTVSPDEVTDHLRLLRLMGGNPFVLSSSFNETGDYHNLTLCYQTNEQTFKNLVGTVTARNMNILGAQIFLRADGVKIITLQVEDTVKHDTDDSLWQRVEKDLDDVLENRRSIRELLAARKRYVAQKNQRKTVIPKIQIDNVVNPAYTIIRVEARDHLGMLYKVVYTLAEFGVQIHRAKISFQGNQGIDVFYVSLRGAKIVFDRLIRQIEERMIGVLLIENVEELG